MKNKYDIKTVIINGKLIKYGGKYFKIVIE